jgi:hypothetical protein
MPETDDNLPGNGFLGWLGRQIGHVAKAVKTDVEAEAGASPPSKIVYRECTIEEKESPIDPNVKLRRTVIDEVIQETQNSEGRRHNEDNKLS